MEVVPTRPGARAQDQPPQLRFRPRPGRRHRLVAVAPGGFDLRYLPAVEGEEEIQIELHRGLSQSMARLYGKPFFAWIEIRAGSGRLIATTQVFEIEPGASGSS